MSDLGLHCLPRDSCPYTILKGNEYIFKGNNSDNEILAPFVLTAYILLEQETFPRIIMQYSTFENPLE